MAAAPAAIYTVPLATHAIIRTVSFVNVGGLTETVKLYVTPSGGTRRKFSQAQLSISEFAHEEEIGTLGPGDALEAETSNATSVDFTVMGVDQV